MKTTKTLLIGLFSVLLLGLSVQESQAQLGLLRKLGKAAGKAGKAGAKVAARAGRSMNPASIARLGRMNAYSGAGLLVGSEVVELSMRSMDDVVGMVSKQGDNLLMRSNVELAEATVGAASEGVGSLMNRHFKKALDNAGDLGMEVVEQGIDLIIDGEVFDEWDWDELSLDSLQALSVHVDGRVYEMERLPGQTEGRLFVKADSTGLWYVPVDQLELLTDYQYLHWLDFESSFGSWIQEQGNAYMVMSEHAAANEAYWLLQRSMDTDIFNLMPIGDMKPINREAFPYSVLEERLRSRDNQRLEEEDKTHWGWYVSLILLMLLAYMFKIRWMGVFDQDAEVSILPFYSWYDAFGKIGFAPWKGLLMSIPVLHLLVSFPFYKRLNQRTQLNVSWMPWLLSLVPWLGWIYLGFVFHFESDEEEDA